MIERTSISLVIVLGIIVPSTRAQMSADVDSSASFSSCTFPYIQVGSTVAITAILLHYDQEIYDGLYQWKSDNRIVKDASSIVTNLGDGAFSLGLFGGFIGYSLICKNEKAYEVGKIGIESFVLTGVTVQLIKHLCSRERPSAATRSAGFWHGPFAYFKKENKGKGISSFDAFPSGHTTTAFSAATVISDFYAETWVSYTCYSLATIVAISRVTESSHWLSDCFVGAIIGHYGTKLVEKWNYGSSPITLMPTVNTHRYGLLLTMRF